MNVFLLVHIVNIIISSLPTMQWSIEYFPGQNSRFTEVLQASTGDYYISGWVSDQSLFKVNQEGELLWTYGIEGYGNQKAYGLVELADESIAITGTCQTSNYYYSLFVAKVQPDGSPVWEMLFDPSSEHNECGFSITEFADGKIMVCGVGDTKNFLYNGSAYFLLISPEGEMLWDGSWGRGKTTSFAIQSSFDGERYNILAHGSDSGTGAPHILWYSPNGQYLGRERIEALASYYTGNGCVNEDAGFTFTSNNGYTCDIPLYAILTRVDKDGEIIWTQHVANYLSQGIYVAKTSAGEYLYGGTEIYTIPIEEPWWTGSRRGTLYSFDANGEELWYLPVSTSSCQRIDALVETSSGGILACGGGASNLYYFSDNTGINIHSDSPESLNLLITPNPFSSSISISIDCPENLDEISITIRDISGRLVYRADALQIGSANSEITWTPEAETPEGCYIITLTTPTFTVSRTCILL